MSDRNADIIHDLREERRYLREALEIIAEHSTDDGSRQLAAAALEFRELQATVRAEAS